MDDLTPDAVADLLIPRWKHGDTYVHVGDEVALLSPVTKHLADAYGRIVGLDPDGSGNPVVLVLSGERPATIQKPIPLSDIIGRRVGWAQQTAEQAQAALDRNPEPVDGRLQEAFAQWRRDDERLLREHR